MADDNPADVLTRFVNMMLATGATKSRIAVLLREVADRLDEADATTEPPRRTNGDGVG